MPADTHADGNNSNVQTRAQFQTAGGDDRNDPELMSCFDVLEKRSAHLREVYMRCAASVADQGAVATVDGFESKVNSTLMNYAEYLQLMSRGGMFFVGTKTFNEYEIQGALRTVGINTNHVIAAGRSFSIVLDRMHNAHLERSLTSCCLQSM
jgi:hypothetical protein